MLLYKCPAVVLFFDSQSDTMLPCTWPCFYKSELHSCTSLKNGIENLLCADSKKTWTSAGFFKKLFLSG